MSISQIKYFINEGSDKSTFPDLYQLDGRELQISGVVDGKGLITLPARIK